MRAATLFLVATGCAAAAGPVDHSLDGLAVTAVAPGAVVPGTELAITGAAFAPPEWGDSGLRLHGVAAGVRRDLYLPVRFVDYTHLAAVLDAAAIEALGGDADFTGDATVEIVSAVDGQLHLSAPLPVSLAVRRQLVPAPTVAAAGVVFVNDPIELAGDGFLLGGAEGVTIALVSGCFAPEGGGPCAPVAPVEVVAAPVDPQRRDRVAFPFVPDIAGVVPGRFTGRIDVENRAADGTVTRAAAGDVAYDLVEPAVFRVGPDAVSLGQYVTVEGGGFVGGAPDASTALRLAGGFTRTGERAAAPVDLVLVPELVSGRTVRYVVSEDDALGQAIDLRRDTGTFRGTVAPVVTWRGTRVVGRAAEVTLALAPVKQVVYLDFRPSYVEALRALGLRALDREIRARVVDVVAEAYRGVNLELRTAPPTDFALFAQVEIAGDDPNGMGLFGYDNSPGKDRGNQRLYDRLGGVNARTQQDGFPGYGGVFVASLLGFSRHPPAGDPIDGADPLFDAIFDPFRPDVGAPVVGAELGGFIPAASADGCPATARPAQIACAVRVLGSLVGGTVAHELGHSLGLANPEGEGFHDEGDAPDRLMDAGGARPFAERAELRGQGPARFCDAEYAYLRAILPAATATDPSPRPVCY